MESAAEFDLKSAITSWEQSNLSFEELTPSDRKELLEHFVETVEEIKSKGLSEEEAFAATCVRFGSHNYWGDNMRELNNESFQQQKLVMLFGGVLMFLFCNYFVLCLHRILLIVVNNLYGDVSAIKTSGNLIYIVYLISFILIVSTIFSSKTPFINLIEKIKLNPKRVILLLIIVFILFVLERYLLPLMRNTIEDRFLLDKFFYKERDFKIIFPFIFVIGFFIMYLKYHKKAEV